MQQQQRKATMRTKQRDSGALDAVCTRGSGGIATALTSFGDGTSAAPAAIPTTSTSEKAIVKHESSDADPCVDEHRQQTYEANAKLCRLVRRNPWLYNRKHTNYAKKNVLDKTWTKIAKDCNDTVASCKERWRNIRAAYARSVNIYKTNGGPNRVKPYYLHKELNFLLKPMLENRNKLQNKNVADREPKEELIESPAAEPINEEHRQQADKAEEECAELLTVSISQQASQQKTDVNGNHTAASESNKGLTDMLPELPYKYLENTSLGDVSLASSNAVSPTPTPTSTSTFAAEPLLSVKRRRLTTELQLICDRANGGIQQQSIVEIAAPLRNNACRVANAADADVKFLEALLPDLRSMNSRQKVIFKRKIYQTLEEVFENNADFPSSSKHMTNIYGGSSTMCDVNSYDANVPLPTALQPMTVILPQGNAPAIGMEPLLPIIVKNEPDDVDIV